LLEQPDQIAVDSTGVMSLLHGTLWSVVGLLVPVLVVLICSGLAGHLLQHRPVFSVERLKPDLSKRSLLKGFKRMFGLDGLSNLAKGVLKLLIIGAVAWTTLWPVRGALQTALNAGVHGV
jgi:flagellar biosynthetic protein FlhB